MGKQAEALREELEHKGYKKRTAIHNVEPFANANYVELWIPQVIENECSTVVLVDYGEQAEVYINDTSQSLEDKKDSIPDFHKSFVDKQ